MNTTTTATNTSELTEVRAKLEEIISLINGFKRDLKGLVEIQQRLIHERLGVQMPNPPKEYGEETKSTLKIDVTYLGSEQIKVSGKTFDYKTAIKEAGPAKFDTSSKSWILSSECLENLIKNFENVGLVSGTDFSVPTTIKTNINVTTDNDNNDNTPSNDDFGTDW